MIVWWDIEFVIVRHCFAIWFGMLDENYDNFGVCLLILFGDAKGSMRFTVIYYEKFCCHLILSIRWNIRMILRFTYW